MPNKFKNFCLLLVLSFLQCLAPLLHAHAGGLHVSSHVHVHAEVPAFHSPAHLPELRVDLCDLPAVGAASEFKRDPAGEDLSAAPPRAVWLVVPPQPPVVAAFPPSSSILSENSLFSGPPPSQAPPVGA